jgi:hypothetical protein
MENPYRIHSSIGFGFLQLLFITSLAYPTPPPPVYHNIALIRLMGTVYFTIFKDKPFYLKLECATILLDVICDTLYIRYIIHDYTYIFGVVDILSNVLFCVFILLSIKNGETQTAKILEKMEDIRITCLSCCCIRRNHPPQGEPPAKSHEMNERTPHLYKSVATNDDATTARETAPIYTYGGRQVFKPSFYNSSWGSEYIQTKVKNEFERIDRCNTNIGEIGVITGANGNTQYIRFDDPEYDGGGGGGTSSRDAGINHYANLFVSPYFTREGNAITIFSGCSNIDSVGVCLFIYNLIQFIYQLMMYSSIIESCRGYATAYAAADAADAADAAAAAEFQMERWLC